MEQTKWVVYACMLDYYLEKRMHYIYSIQGPAGRAVRALAQEHQYCLWQLHNRDNTQWFARTYCGSPLTAICESRRFQATFLHGHICH